MVGLLMWKERGKKDRAVTVRECAVLHMRFLRADIIRGPKTPEAILRRRVAAAAKRLRKQDVTRVVLPEGFPYTDVLEKQGVRPVSTLSLRRRLAADWVRAALTEQQLPVGGARVAVAAEELTGEVVRTVTELVLRHRYVLLDLPRGGEDLCRQLRREYGVALLLGPSKEQLEEAEALVLFDERPVRENPVCLRLYDESQSFPKLALPPALEEQLPVGLERAQLLAVLQEAGTLKPGQITVEGNRR